VHDSLSDFSRIKGAYFRLLSWFQDNGGDLDETTLYGMSQDDPDVTPQQLCRFDWCLSVPADWQAEGEVAIRELPKHRIASVRCVGDASLETKTIQFLFLYWLPRSQFEPANLPGMEIYNRQPAEMGWETYDLDCAIPIVPL
jgi:AraC family transcriptional regulator